MKRSILVKWGSLKVGSLVMFGIVVAMYASLTGGGTSIFDSKGEFMCYFKSVDGLLKGSPVWMAGVEVGNVKSVRFVNLDSLRVVEVICRIRRSVWPMMTNGTEVAIGTIGFLGDKFVNVYPGPVEAQTIAEGEILPTRSVGDAANMFKAGEEAFRGTGSLIGSLDTFLVRMNRGEGTLGQITTDKALYQQLTSLVGDLAQLTKQLQESQRKLTRSIESVAQSTGKLADQISDTAGTVGRLFHDPALYNRLASTSARLDSITAHINRGEGNLGMIVKDTAMYVELTNLLARVNNLVTDIEKNPRKYLKFSVF